MGVIPQQFNRDQLTSFIYTERACEVGVQTGNYTKIILSNMPSLHKLYLVDLWTHQQNYVDLANVSDAMHQGFFQQALAQTNPWADKIEILRGLSVVMCKNIPDNSLDWIYIDARHDYKGAAEDIESYWPKLKTGGIMSGHDYMTSDQVKQITPGQDWSVCYDGSVEPRAVKGAVDDFATNLNKDVYVTNDQWPSWSIYK